MRSVFAVGLMLCLGSFQIAYSQRRPAMGDRIVGSIDTEKTHTLAGQPHSLARSQNDSGPVEPATPINYMMVVFKPSPAQQAELDQLLADQQNPSSPSFHQWLTPEEFGERFGISRGDYAKVTAWLASEGFTLNEYGRARNWVAFSGTAERVARALHTSIRRYVTNGGIHFANATEPAIPEALADVVGGILGLDDFPMTSHARLVPPDHNRGGAHYLVPQDFATIYNLMPLYTADINGTGQKIVVVGESEVSRTDLQKFRSTYGLPVNDPLFMPYSGTSPGFNDAEFEGDLDLEWAGAVAPNAQLIYVYGTNAMTAMAVSVNLNAGPIVEISYGGCEAGFRLEFYRAILQQGNAQGITFINSSGDTGAAGCDIQASEVLAARGLAAGFPAVLPEVTGVGGTQFVEGSGIYWASTNSANLGSALSYIPEAAWNESSTTNGLSSSGGGASALYPQPLWQNGPAVPNDGARHVPDVSLNAAGHDAYVIQYHGFATPVFGTSASATAFAGIVALLNQSQVSNGSLSKPGLGNINPQLYRLAQIAPGVFHDITLSGNSVPCEQGSKDCLTGSFGFNAVPGYDMATGLGSVDASALINSWNTAAAATTLKLAASRTRATINDTEQLTATVAAATGGGFPTGTVTFAFNGIPLGSATLSSGNATISFPLYRLGGFGTTTVAAEYLGDSTFSPSGATVRIQVTVPASGAAMLVSAPDTVWPIDFPDAQGTAWQTNLVIRELAGNPAIITAFAIDGSAQSVTQYFGSNEIQAFSTTNLSVVLRNIATPSVHTFAINGIDAVGVNWSREVSVNYLPLPSVASNVLVTATPLIVARIRPRIPPVSGRSS